MIIIKDLNRNPIATLENATEIGYEKVTNDLWTAHFTMPEQDPDNKYITPRHFVEVYDDLKNEYIGLFIVMPNDKPDNRKSNVPTGARTRTFDRILAF